MTNLLSPITGPHTSWEVGEQSASKPLRPFGSLAAYEDEKREINAWFYAEWMKLLAERGHREREAERKFWAGGYQKDAA